MDNYPILNVDGCTGLYDIQCTGHQLESLDLSSCTSLNYLECSNNNITSLN